MTFVWAWLAFSAAVVAVAHCRIRREQRWHDQRAQWDALQRAEAQRRALAPVMDRHTERVDVLEVWFRLPARVPPHERTGA